MRSTTRYFRRTTPPTPLGALGLESAVEDLGLSVRATNGLRGLGCNTVGDALRLDLSSFMRGVGRKTKEELVTKLERVGFHHPMLDAQPESEISILTHRLERLQGRIDEVLKAVGKEVELIRQSLHRRAALRAGGNRGVPATGPSQVQTKDATLEQKGALGDR